MTTDTIVVILAVVVALALIVFHFQMRQLKLQLDGRLTELLRVTKSLARSEGFAAGQLDHLEEIRRAGESVDGPGSK